jgi:hypothetical protein
MGEGNRGRSVVQPQADRIKIKSKVVETNDQK